jgi:hypothetical protein
MGKYTIGTLVEGKIVYFYIRGTLSATNKIQSQNAFSIFGDREKL